MVRLGSKPGSNHSSRPEKNSKEKRAHALSGVSGIWCESQAQTTVPDQKKNSKEKRAHALSGVSGIWCESQAQTAVPDQKKNSKEKRAHALSGVSGIWCVWCWVLHVRSTCACPIDPVNPNILANLMKRSCAKVKRLLSSTELLV